MTRLYISLILVVFTLTSIKNSEAHRVVCTKVGLFRSHWGSLCHTLAIVCHLSSVSRSSSVINYDIKSIFGANFSNVPGLCLIVIGGPYISHKIIAQKLYFTFSTYFLKQPADGASYYDRRFPKINLVN